MLISRIFFNIIHVLIVKKMSQKLDETNNKPIAQVIAFIFHFKFILRKLSKTIFFWYTVISIFFTIKYFLNKLYTLSPFNHFLKSL